MQINLIANQDHTRVHVFFDQKYFGNLSEVEGQWFFLHKKDGEYQFVRQQDGVTKQSFGNTELEAQINMAEYLETNLTQ